MSSPFSSWLRGRSWLTVGIVLPVTVGCAEAARHFIVRIGVQAAGTFSSSIRAAFSVSRAIRSWIEPTLEIVLGCSIKVRVAVSVTLPIGGLVVLPFVFGIWGAVASPWIWPEYDYLLERFSAVAVFDSKQRFLGAIPGPIEPWRDFISPDYKSVYVDVVPEAWLDCFNFLEDRHRNSWWRSGAGVDSLSFIRAFGSLKSGAPQGASTAPMQLARSLRHRAADPDELQPQGHGDSSRACSHS
jgi:hypothetical protein